MQELGADIDELVCGSKNDVHTEDLDIIMNEYDDSSKPFAMKIIAESIMHYRNMIY